MIKVRLLGDGYCGGEPRTKTAKVHHRATKQRQDESHTKNSSLQDHLENTSEPILQPYTPISSCEIYTLRALGLGFGVEEGVLTLAELCEDPSAEEPGGVALIPKP